MLWPNGDAYFGTYQNKKRNGFGILVKGEGEIYIGKFKDGLYEDERGIICYTDGSFIFGNFIEG